MGGRRWLVAAVALVVAGVGIVTGPTSATAGPPGFAVMDPGGAARLRETVPVQIVLVGYERDQIAKQPFLEALPRTAKPEIRMRHRYGIAEPVGLELTYDYRLSYASRAYEDAFFGFLQDIAVPEEAVSGFNESLYQFFYNEQQANVAVAHDNLVIDAPSVERWLVEHPAPGIHPERNTLVLVNWWGRDDFRFHTYRHTGEPDADTGVDLGATEEGRLIAWGGTSARDEESGFGRPSRLWFHDLSAGPDWGSGGWMLDTAFVEGGRTPRPFDNRLPPVWEYLLPGGFGSPEALATDLASVARYVAVDSLFTSSPLYPPYLDQRRLPSEIELDVTSYDDEGAEAFDAPQVKNELDKLMGGVSSSDGRPGIGLDVTTRPLDGEVASCFDAFLADEQCLPGLDPARYPPRANLFLSQARSLDAWRDGSAEHEAGAFIYPVQPDQASLGGFADDNHIDGTQSGVFTFADPRLQAFGWGQTYFQIHEFGHHLGLSHTADGFDSERGQEFGWPGNPSFFFTLVGEETNSVMTQMFINQDFSQFEIDNMQRWHAAAFLRSANLIAADVLRAAAPGRGRPTVARVLLAGADREFVAAQAALTVHDYATAESRGQTGYRLVLAAADAAGVTVATTNDGWRLPDGVPPAAAQSLAAPGQRSAPSVAAFEEEFAPPPSPPQEVLDRRRPAHGVVSRG